MKKITLLLLFLLNTSFLLAQDSLLWKGRCMLLNSVYELSFTSTSLLISPFEQSGKSLISERSILWKDIKKIRKNLVMSSFTFQLENGEKLLFTNFSRKNKQGLKNTIKKMHEQRLIPVKVSSPPFWQYVVAVPLILVAPQALIPDPAVK